MTPHPDDDGIWITGINTTTTPTTSNINFTSSPMSSSNEISTLYNELSKDNKQALLTQALITNNNTKIYLLSSKNSSASLATLSEKLLTHADKHKIPELCYDVQAHKHCLLHHNWFTRLLPIGNFFPQTSPVYNDNNIVPFTDPSCIGNQALFLLLSAQVDNFYRNLICPFDPHGDMAL
jgi:hypothetical protein